MFFVYILKSSVVDKFYIGQTQDINNRIVFHNRQNARWTKRYQPWILLYKEEFKTRADAMKREKELKSLKNIKRFLDKNLV